VALRRDRDQVTGPELDLRLAGTEQDSPLQTEHRRVTGTLVLTHHLACPQRDKRLSQARTGPAVHRDRATPAPGRGGLG
jgi:hypothetical protein